MKYVIIFGTTGMLGRYLLTYLVTNPKYIVISINRDLFDAITDSYTKLEGLLLPYKSLDTIIINCYGIIPQSYSLVDIHSYIKVNTLFPQVLSQLSDKYSMKFIHVTTDCVFDGLDGQYNELNQHTETNIYGITKSLGEPFNSTVIRTSIIGEELKNKKSLLEWTRNNKDKLINGFTSHLWNGVTCLQLAKIINQIIEKNMYWKGVRHIFSPDIVSKYELIVMINEIYDLNIAVNPLDTIMVDKTLSTIYKQNRLFNIPYIYNQVKELKKWNIGYFKISEEEHLYSNI